MKSLLKYLKEYRKEAVLAPLFKLLEATFELIVPLVMAAIIDTGIGTQNRPYILKMCGVLVLLAAVGLVSAITAQWFAAKAATGFSAKLRHLLFEHIQELSFSQMDLFGTDTLITRMTSDVNQVQNGVNLVLRLFMRSPFIVFGAMVMAFTVDVKAAMIFVVTIPVLSVVVFGIMLWTMPLYRKVQGKLDRIMTGTRENLTGVRVIRAFGREESEEESFRTENAALSRMQQFVGKISGLMNPVTYILINLATVYLIYTGAVRVDCGILTQGQVVALLNYMSQILVELIKLANLIIQVTKAWACGDRIADILKVEPDMKDGLLPADAVRDSETAVEFRNVSLTYEEGAGEALQNISFKVRRGETIGIIGGTGSGKSSLVNLIPRFYDVSQGEVLVGGHNVKEYRQEELRSRIGVVLQKAVLFKGTIARNLSFGKSNASAEEMDEALAVSQAKEYVDLKPGRTEFELEQNGRNLSGGQKQRMTIARALIRKPDILILDDSASALDFATDAKLRMAIRGMSRTLTTFIVSQRAASVQYADQILVMDDGRLAGIGTHAELLAGNPVYQEIYYSQFPKEEEA
ncbi:MAG: ABC transporter ATP-binding protein [Bacillota bacterium]|nr:ABC transporter ATP-binding protein [Bacillota bacterium]